MRILIVADPYIPVPPTLYGGIERIIAFLVDGLVARGHAVTLLAHPDSAAACTELVPYGCPPHAGSRSRLLELAQIQSGLLRRIRHVDVVHSFGRLAGLLPLLPLRWIPKIQSYQRAVSWPGIRRASMLAGSSLTFTACSTAMYREQVRRKRGLGSWRTIFNGVELAKYRAVPRVPSDAPLVFLGQLHPMKGPHVAVRIARATGRRLIIAGSKADGANGRVYFERTLAPLFGDGVEYVGPVNDAQKNDLLGRAAAMVFPSFYDEAFGIVMAEAMACGTPVIGWDFGSVAEVIKDSVTGFVCRNEPEAVAAVERLNEIDRRTVRRDCEVRFGSDVIVDHYERLYQAVASREGSASKEPCAAS